ncbi:Histone-lysine N-methyltransferase TRX1 [Linum perenne]
MDREFPKRTRSLDLKSLYETKSTEDGKNLKRKGCLNEDGDCSISSNKRKKSGKAVNRLKTVTGNGSRSLEEVYNGSLTSVAHASKDSHLCLNQKSNDSSGFNNIALTLEDEVIKIPRRKRGIVRRRKVENGGEVLKLEAKNGHVGDADEGGKGTDDQDHAIPIDNGESFELSKLKRKNRIDDFKENQNAESNSGSDLKEVKAEDDPLILKNGESSPKKSFTDHSTVNSQEKPSNGSLRKRSRKRKNKVLEVRSPPKEAEPSGKRSVKNVDKVGREDEENLEENAARMLSSRFDPSCTGFLLKKKVSSLPHKNGSRHPPSSGKDFYAQGAHYASGSDTASDDAALRVLRPRKQFKEKGSTRKRRHFYEIFSSELDAYWVLNRRIKVFWPLDESWYYGLVSDYDKERKLHHVKYDDRDEEWIDLQNERFKLLLFPSEAPGRNHKKRSASRRKRPIASEGKLPSKKDNKKNMFAEEDSLVGNHMDSEPIISWLARSSRRVKSPPVSAPKKQNKSFGAPGSGRPLTKDTVDGSECRDRSSLNVQAAKMSSNSTLQNELATSVRSEFDMASPLCTNAGKLPFVYYRRRFRKKNILSSHDSMASHVSSSALDPDAYCTPSYSEVDFSKLMPVDSLWSIDGSGNLELNFTTILSRRFTFKLSCHVASVQDRSFSKLNTYLCHAVLVLHFGKMMAILPRVQLEMLIVDNVVGLRFLLFEGSLKQAVAFVFVVLEIFGQPDEPGKSIHLELPVTSIKFRFSCPIYGRKQLVFLFYRFSEVENSSWINLEHKINKHCTLTRQLPLSQCTYDNIKGLENKSNGLLGSALKGTAKVKGSSRRSWQHANLMSVPREPRYAKTSHFFNPEMDHRHFPPISLSFTAAPSFFLGLHRRLLVEHTLTRISFQDHGSVGDPETSDSMLLNDQSFRTPDSNCRNGPRASCSLEPKRSNTIFGASSVAEEHVNMGNGASYELQLQPSDSIQQKLVTRSSTTEGVKFHTQSPPLCNGMTVEIPSSDKFDKHCDGNSHVMQQSSDLSWNLNSGIIPSPNPTARRSTWHRTRSNSASFGGSGHGWSEGRADLLQSNFGNGPKKPRTQVNYALPFGGFDIGSRGKGHQHKMPPHKRIRTSNEKRSSDASKAPERNLELLSCDVNLLLTVGDKGWREQGVQVVLEHFDHSEWRLAVKVSGTTKYSYKAHQFLQLGSTNRFTHAMMWKGGKDWILEFPDRSQWTLFKEMHEECYNRNVRAALVKNIPIPGVRLIEENEDQGTIVPFFRSSMYFCQVETDVEMALNPSRVLYDIDSDDERWMSEKHKTLEVQNGSSTEISEELFQNIMDMFEKTAYSRQCDHFTAEEVEELMAGLGSLEVIKMIYEYWHQKRNIKEMPLIRHLQPPRWERYQQEVREWEQAKAKSLHSNGCSKKVADNEKPALFAFCLKPRGLDLPNRGSKHRSHKKLSVSGQSHTFSAYHDGFHAYGRRLNGFAYGDERVSWVHNYESMDDSPLPQRSPRFFSLRDADGSSPGYIYPHGNNRFHMQRIQRSKSKKAGKSLSPMGSQREPSYNERMLVERIDGEGWTTEWANQRQWHLDWSHGSEQLDSSDVEEFRMRDPSGAAEHALNLAKFKREKAQRLLCRADLAIHKAVVALMTAEAIKASTLSSSSSEEDDEEEEDDDDDDVNS